MTSMPSAYEMVLLQISTWCAAPADLGSMQLWTKRLGQSSSHACHVLGCPNLAKEELEQQAVTLQLVQAAHARG